METAGDLFFYIPPFDFLKIIYRHNFRQYKNKLGLCVEYLTNQMERKIKFNGHFLKNGTEVKMKQGF